MVVDKAFLVTNLRTYYNDINVFVDYVVAYVEISNASSISLVFTFDDINKLFKGAGLNSYSHTALVMKEALDTKTRRKKKISKLEFFYDNWIDMNE